MQAQQPLIYPDLRAPVFYPMPNQEVYYYPNPTYPSPLPMPVQEPLPPAAAANSFPTRIWSAAGKSFLCSFTISTLLSGNPAVGIVGGLGGAMASLISTTTFPLFQPLWGTNAQTSREKWYQFLSRSVVVIALTSLMSAHLFGGCVHIVASTLFNLLLHCTCSSRKTNLNKARTFVVF